MAHAGKKIGFRTIGFFRNDHRARQSGVFFLEFLVQQCPLGVGQPALGDITHYDTEHRNDLKIILGSSHQGDPNRRAIAFYHLQLAALLST